MSTYLRQRSWRHPWCLIGASGGEAAVGVRISESRIICWEAGLPVIALARFKRRLKTVSRHSLLLLPRFPAILLIALRCSRPGPPAHPAACPPPKHKHPTCDQTTLARGRRRSFYFEPRRRIVPIGRYRRREGAPSRQATGISRCRCFPVDRDTLRRGHACIPLARVGLARPTGNNALALTRGFLMHNPRIAPSWVVRGFCIVAHRAVPYVSYPHPSAATLVRG